MDDALPEGRLHHQSGDVRPIPDPTTITSMVIEAAKQEMRRELQAAREILEARLDASDKAIVLLQTTQDRIPGHVIQQISHLESLMEQRFKTEGERFRGISVQFSELDKRMDQAATSTKIAVDAALQAQKEAVAAQNANIAQAMARIEATATKQIEQLITLLQTTAGASNDKIDDLKQRLTLMEGRTAGITSATTTQRDTVKAGLEGNQWVLALLMGGVAVLGVLVAIGIAALKP